MAEGAPAPAPAAAPTAKGCGSALSNGSLGNAAPAPAPEVDLDPRAAAEKALRALRKKVRSLCDRTVPSPLVLLHHHTFITILSSVLQQGLASAAMLPRAAKP
jgi:hypothetical protein